MNLNFHDGNNLKENLKIAYNKVVNDNQNGFNIPILMNNYNLNYLDAKKIFDTIKKDYIIYLKNDLYFVKSKICKDEKRYANPFDEDEVFGITSFIESDQLYAINFPYLEEDVIYIIKHCVEKDLKKSKRKRKNLSRKIIEQSRNVLFDLMDCNFFKKDVCAIFAIVKRELEANHEFSPPNVKETSFKEATVFPFDNLEFFIYILSRYQNNKNKIEEKLNYYSKLFNKYNLFPQYKNQFENAKVLIKKLSPYIIDLLRTNKKAAKKILSLMQPT